MTQRMPAQRLANVIEATGAEFGVTLIVDGVGIDGALTSHVRMAIGKLTSSGARSRSPSVPNTHISR